MSDHDVERLRGTAQLSKSARRARPGPEYVDGKEIIVGAGRQCDNGVVHPDGFQTVRQVRGEHLRPTSIPVGDHVQHLQAVSHADRRGCS